MVKENLHPELVKFKDFVNKHPGLIANVRRGKQDWQYYFEQWTTLGEEDQSWQQYRQEGMEEPSEEKTNKKDEKNKQAWYKQMAELANKVDFNNMEEHVNQLDSAFASVRALIDQFKSDDAAPTPPTDPVQQPRYSVPPNPQPNYRNQRWY